MYFSILVGLFYVDYPVLLIMCGAVLMTKFLRCFAAYKRVSM